MNCGHVLGMYIGMWVGVYVYCIVYSEKVVMVVLYMYSAGVQKTAQLGNSAGITSFLSKHDGGLATHSLTHCSLRTSGLLKTMSAL